MRVEIKIDTEQEEPYAILHVPRLTEEIGALVELLEHHHTGGTQGTLIAKKEDRLYVIAPEQIDLIRTEGGHVLAYDREAYGLTLDKTLREVTERLGNDFVRISKSAIVNIKRIDHVSPSFHGTMDIIMKNGMQDYISRKFLGDFKKRLGL